MEPLGLQHAVNCACLASACGLSCKRMMRRGSRNVRMHLRLWHAGWRVTTPPSRSAMAPEAPPVHSAWL